MFGLSLECHPITNFELLSHCFATKERALLTDLSFTVFFAISRTCMLGPSFNYRARFLEIHFENF